MTHYAFSHGIMGICFVLISDAFTILDAPTSDLSATVSTNEEGSSSMFANYGDDSGDQSSLGKYFIRD